MKVAFGTAISSITALYLSRLSDSEAQKAYLKPISEIERHYFRSVYVLLVALLPRIVIGPRAKRRGEGGKRKKTPVSEHPLNQRPRLRLLPSSFPLLLLEILQNFKKKERVKEKIWERSWQVCLASNCLESDGSNDRRKSSCLTL
jgi:hypothetical protein